MVQEKRRHVLVFQPNWRHDQSLLVSVPMEYVDCHHRQFNLQREERQTETLRRNNEPNSPGVIHSEAFEADVE